MTKLERRLSELKAQIDALRAEPGFRDQYSDFCDGSCPTSRHEALLSDVYGLMMDLIVEAKDWEQKYDDLVDENRDASIERGLRF